MAAVQTRTMTSDERRALAARMYPALFPESAPPITETTAAQVRRAADAFPGDGRPYQSTARLTAAFYYADGRRRRLVAPDPEPAPAGSEV